MTVAPNPTQYNLTGGSYCAGGSGVTVTLANSEIGVNYQLQKNSVNDGGIIAGTGSALNFTNKLFGSYSIIATLAGSPFCTSTVGPTMVIEVPNPTIYNLSGGSYCIGGTGITVTLADSDIGVNYQLQKNGIDDGGIIAGTGSALNFSNKLFGSYSIIATLAASPFCSSTTGPASVIENPLPLITCPAPLATGVTCGVNEATAQQLANIAFTTWFDQGPVSTPNYTVVATYTYSAGAAPIPNDRAPLILAFNDPTILSTSVTVTWTVTDGNGCVNSCSSTFTLEYGCQIGCTTGFTNLTCNGNQSGTLTVTVGGGTPPYTAYLFLSSDLVNPISNSGSVITEGGSYTFNGLAAGNYIVITTDATTTIVDGGVCTATLTEPPVLASSTTQVNVLCFGNATGSVDLTVTGGASPYTYLWNNGATTQDLSGLVAGTYSVTVTDSNGCTTQNSVTITEPPVLASSTTQVNVLCYGNATGSVDLTVTGGASPYTYLWNNGATTQDLSGLVAGTYSVTVTDSNGCTTQNSVTITEPPVLASSTTQVNVLCFGNATGSVDLTVTGGASPYTYLWNNGATTQDLSGLVAGTYSVMVTDSNGCTTQNSVTITEPTLLTATVTTTDETCEFYDGLIDLTVIGGTPPYTYLWSNGATTQDLIAGAGVYTVVITDANLCNITSGGTLIAPICGYGCTPGYWQGGNGKPKWDQTTDPIAILAGFTTNSSFYTVFGIAPGTCGLPVTLSMVNSINLGGGNCKKLVRHGSAGLLNAITLSGLYPLPAGISNVAAFKLAIKNAIISCNCEPLASQIAANNELNHDLCGLVTSNSKMQPATANSIESVGFEVYPVPFKDQLTIRFTFDYKTDVKIVIFDMLGRALMTYEDKDAYFGKEVILNPEFVQKAESIYFIKVFTNRGYETKKIISGR